MVIAGRFPHTCAPSCRSFRLHLFHLISDAVQARRGLTSTRASDCSRIKALLSGMKESGVLQWFVLMLAKKHKGHTCRSPVFSVPTLWRRVTRWCSQPWPWKATVGRWRRRVGGHRPDKDDNAHERCFVLSVQKLCNLMQE